MYNEEIGIHFKRYCSTCLNLIPLDEIENDFALLINDEYIGICDHEQYFYADYLAYQPDHTDKIMKMCEILVSNGYEFICGEDIIK